VWTFVSQPLFSKVLVVLVAAALVLVAYRVTPPAEPGVASWDAYAFGTTVPVMARASPLTEDNHPGLLLIVFIGVYTPRAQHDIDA
jgi:hypothetical protein